MRHQSCSWIRFLCLSAAVLLLPSKRTSTVVRAYPIVVVVDEGEERCFRFNVPQDDDASMVFLVVPSEEDVSDEALEIFYVDQVYKLIKSKSSESGEIPTALPEPAPDNVAKLMSDFLKDVGGNKSPLTVKVSNTLEDGTNYRNMQRTKFFVPTVMNHIIQTNERNYKRKNLNTENMEHGICLQNNDDDIQVQVIYDIVLVSEEIIDDESQPDFKERHLTPLEESLDQSIASAQSVLREMRYLEKREQRMRMTADSINTRVRWFSYLSVAVLLSVTYIQVTYLKRYFHKKKLM